MPDDDLRPERPHHLDVGRSDMTHEHTDHTEPDGAEPGARGNEHADLVHGFDTGPQGADEGPDVEVSDDGSGVNAIDDDAIDDDADTGPGALHVLGARRMEGAPQNRARSRRRRVIVAVAALVMVVGVALAAIGLTPLVQRFTAPDDYDGPGSGAVTVVVNNGDTGSDIAKTLHEDGVVKTTAAFLTALDDTQGQPEVQPGHYTLQKQMKASDALAALRAGRNVVRVTVREGLWKSEVFKALATATKTPIADYLTAEKAARAHPETLGLPASAKGNLEGYLFPATYEFDPKTSAQDQLKELVSHATTQLRALGVSDAQMERTVILASIVEAEARLDADRPKVARVLLNRLAQKMPLQLDSTVSYGVQRKSITTTDAERANKNGYNTYIVPGLPAGPIGNPGAESIKAVLNPVGGTWLFFVTVDPSTGRTVFSVDGAGHAKAVAQFQQWCQSHPGKC